MGDAVVQAALDTRGDELLDSGCRREDEQTTRVVDVMVRRPKTLPADATVSEAATALAGGHVHMLLLTRTGTLLGTLVPEDLTGAAVAGTSASAPALSVASLRGRTVHPDLPAEDAQRAMVSGGRRRLAVVGPEGTLLGLMCLKRRGRGFCSDADVASRSGIRPDAT